MDFHVCYTWIKQTFKGDDCGRATCEIRYCEARSNYAIVKRLDLVKKKLDMCFHCAKPGGLENFVKLGGSESVNDAKGVSNGGASRGFAGLRGASRRFSWMAIFAKLSNLIRILNMYIYSFIKVVHPFIYRVGRSIVSSCPK